MHCRRIDFAARNFEEAVKVQPKLFGIEAIQVRVVRGGSKPRQQKALGKLTWFSTLGMQDPPFSQLGVGAITSWVQPRCNIKLSEASRTITLWHMEVLST